MTCPATTGSLSSASGHNDFAVTWTRERACLEDDLTDCITYRNEKSPSIMKSLFYEFEESLVKNWSFIYKLIFMYSRLDGVKHFSISH